MYYKRLLTIISLTVIVSQVLFAQTKAVNRDKYRIHISKTDEHLNIDGILDEKG